MRRLSMLIGVVLVALVAGACIPPPPPPPPSGPHRDVVMFGDSNGWGIGCYLGHEGIAASGPPLPCNPQPDFSTQNESLGACSIAGGQTLLYNRFVLAPSCANWRSAWPGILDERTPELAIINTGGWEINDRWINLPPGCSTFNAFNCPEPDYQWGDPAGDPQLVAAQQRYRGELDDAIDLIRSKGAKVLVINSPYYDPVEPQVPGLSLVWYERYPDDGGSGHPERADWVAPNVNLHYRPSERKTDQFNAALKEVVDAKAAADPNNIGFLDLWDITSPFNPATGDKEANDFLCAPPANGQWPQNGCPNGAPIPIHTEDHGHFSQAGYEQVIMPFVFSKVRQMLS